MGRNISLAPGAMTLSARSIAHAAATGPKVPLKAFGAISIFIFIRERHFLRA
jgi:hypothetical protein